jgi:moderate conductance mechanosensitive channel
MHLLLLIPLLLSGQSSSTSQTAQTTQTRDAGARAGLDAASELRRLESQAKADEQALQVISQDLGEMLAKLSAPLPPAPMPLSEMNFEDLQQVKPEVMKSRDYLEAWQAREDWTRRAAELAGAGEAISAGLVDAYEFWLQRVVALRPVLIETQRRIGVGELREADLGLAPGELSELLGSTAEQLAAREALLSSAQDLAETFERDRAVFDALAPPDPELVRQAERIAHALGTISEAVAAESELVTRLEAAPVETLPTELDRIWQEWEARRASATSAAETYDLAAATYFDATRERSEREVPRTTDVPEGDELLEVRRARRDAESSRRLIEYYESDIELLGRVVAARESLVAAAAESTRRHAAFSRQTARVFATIQLIAARIDEGELVDWTLPDEIDPRAVWDAWRMMQVKEGDRLERSAMVGSAESMTNARQIDESRLTEERETLRIAEARLQTELSHAEFVATMEQRRTEELVALLAPEAGIEAELARIDEQLRASKLELASADAACIELADELREIESPYSRRILQNRVGRPLELEKLLEQLTEGQVLPDISETLEPNAQDMLREADNYQLTDAPQGEPLQTARWEEERLTSQQVFMRILLSYYQRLGDARERLITSTELRRELGYEREGLIEERLRQLKMRYAAANELSARAASGVVDRAELPDQLMDWSSSIGVVRANEVLRDWRKDNANFLARADYLIERLGVITEIGSVVRDVSESADLRANLIGTPVSRMTSALTEVKNLEDVIAMNLRFQAQVRQAEETKFLDSAMKRFSPEAVVERFEEPLETYYLELANSERVISELKKAEEAYARIAEIWRSDRERLLPARAISARVIAQREFDYQAMRYALSVAVFPGAMERIEQSFRQAFGRELPYRLDIRVGDTSGSISALFAAEMRLIAQAALEQDLERLLSKAGIELEVSWYQEQVSRVRAMLERARSDRDEMRRNIDELRANYRERLKANAAIGISVTLSIPIVAWLIVLMLRRGAKRFEFDSVGELGEHASDRKRRLRTLARTMTAALTVLIWTLAAVYIFAQLGLDITPLVASASVVGLAVAFGAQALIKDFFYGFFILLENQFTAGDVVKLGTIAGTVEKISLRITILRDLKGVVHYIPNGSIGQVSNMTQGWARVVFEVSVPYREDPDRASEVLRQVLIELYQDEAWAGRILEEPVVAGVEGLTERSIDIRLMIKTRPGRQWEVAREARRRIKRRLDQEGFESPFPHRVVHHVHDGVEGRAELEGSSEG